MEQRREPSIGNTDIVDLYRRPTGYTAREKVNEPRQPWLAFLLGVFCTPVAFAYVGRPFWGVAYQALVLATLVAFGIFGIVQSFAGIWSLMALVICFQLAAVGLPWWFARRARVSYTPIWCNRWYAYLLLAIVVSAPATYALMNKERWSGFATYRMPTSSMSPTFELGDLFVADTRAGALAAVKANDIVVFRSWHDPAVVFVKRIIAMPGQAVHIDGKGLTVDRQPEQRIGATGSDMMSAVSMRFVDVKLGADEFYVVGDNRNNSDDSRSEGPMKRADIVGRVTTLYFSGDGRRLGPIR